MTSQKTIGWCAVHIDSLEPVKTNSWVPTSKIYSSLGKAKASMAISRHQKAYKSGKILFFPVTIPVVI